MIPQSEVPRRARTGRLFLGLGIGLLFLVGTFARGIAGFYTDYLWFNSLDFTSLWSGVILAKVGLFLAALGGFFVLCWGNLLLAERLAPAIRPAGPEEATLAEVRELLDRRPGTVRIGIALLLAFIFGSGAAGRWNEWILFRNHVSFGVDDPQFGRDIGFYVFQLPFLAALTNVLFSALVVTLIVTAVAHYVNGGIRFQIPGRHVTPAVKAHLSVLMATIALVKAGNYFLDRFALAFSTRGAVQGATYTDVNAQLPALNLLIVISIVAALLFLVSIRRSGWALPITAVGLWGLVAVVAGSVYPTVVQRFRVEPAES
ncbi:MAG: UPF0182 family protein, partial [Acidimicrobiales bacterium]|nr:UPF0182 family protein [Acidimicrobiales bacterium]